MPRARSEKSSARTVTPVPLTRDLRAPRAGPGREGAVLDKEHRHQSAPLAQRGGGVADEAAIRGLEGVS
jgi:hypothetical protein